MTIPKWLIPFVSIVGSAVAAIWGCNVYFDARERMRLVEQREAIARDNEREVSSLKEFHVREMQQMKDSFASLLDVNLREQENRRKSESEIAALKHAAALEKLTTANGDLNKRIALAAEQRKIETGSISVRFEDFFIDIPSGSKLIGEKGYKIDRNFVMPEMIGWTDLGAVSLAQIEAYLKDETIKMPEQEEWLKNNFEWMPVFHVFYVGAGDQQIIVGVATINKKIMWTAASDYISKMGLYNPELIKKVNASIFAQKPVCMLATAVISSNLAFYTEEILNVKALYSSMKGSIIETETTADGIVDAQSIVVLEDDQNAYLIFSKRKTRDAINPYAQQAIQWLSDVKIVRR
jgi:hypothetical protein